MKSIALRTKPEPQKQLNFRVPASLKTLVEENRQLANECGIDYNASAVDYFTKWNTDLHAQLRATHNKIASSSTAHSPSSSSAVRNNGSSGNAEVR
jgi:hypothetical protein